MEDSSTTDRLNFDRFDICRLLQHGASLLGSAGAEFEVQDEKSGEVDPKERIARQRKLLQKKLGLNMGEAIGMSTEELFNDEDLDYTPTSAALVNKQPVRHGAGTGLREILKAHGKSGGKIGDSTLEEVVAPVRETCAQTLGVVLKHMNETGVHKTVDVLLKLLTQEQWEVRHGGLLGIKYALAVRQDVINTLLPKVLSRIIEGLQDLDDDVRAVAAASLVPVVESLVYLQTQKVWMELLSKASVQYVVAAACPWMGAWLCLMMQPSHLPIDLNMLLEVKARAKEKTGVKVRQGQSQSKEVLQEYIAGADTIMEDPATRDFVVMRARMMAAKLLGALCCCICDPGVNVVTQEIKPAESLGQLLLFHLNSKSALQRISVALVICEWAALQKECRAVTLAVQPRLLDILSEHLYYDEIAVPFTRMQNECKQLISSLADAHIEVGNRVNNNVFTIDQANDLVTTVFNEVTSSFDLNPQVLQQLDSKRQQVQMTVTETNQEWQVLQLRVHTFAAWSNSEKDGMHHTVTKHRGIITLYRHQKAAFAITSIPDPPNMSEELIQLKAKERHFLEQLLDGKKLENYKIPVPINAELRKYQQNNVLELWSLFDFLMPGFLGTERQFAARYGKPILASRDARSSSREQEAGVLAMDALHRQVLPFLLRRMKEDVLQDLPPKIIQDYYCTLSPLQVQLYEDFAKSRAKCDVDETVSSAALSEETEKPKLKATGHVFQALQYLRKLCNHPALVLTPQHPEFKSTTEKLAVQNSSLHDIQHAPKLSALKQLLLDCGLGSGSTSESGTESVVAQHRVLIFCQLKSMLDIVEHDLLKPHLPSVTYLRLDGSIPPGQRHSIVSRFNNDPSIDVLLLTTHVGGLGLNLTGADTVVFVEHDWNPMRDLQAMDRAHRIGQKRVVNVYRLITRGTLEEKIMGLQKFKMNIANTVISQENSSLQSMGTDQLLDLFTLDKDGKAEKADTSTSGKASMKSILENLSDLWDQEQYDSEYSLENFMHSLK
ncbi:TATA-binding protein-associated factor 172-like protein [Camelus ferus]|nr:TATA-binding protein-associated factor 172-like protein [Camelus ferus]